MAGGDHFGHLLGLKRADVGDAASVEEPGVVGQATDAEVGRVGAAVEHLRLRHVAAVGEVEFGFWRACRCPCGCRGPACGCICTGHLWAVVLLLMLL